MPEINSLFFEYSRTRDIATRNQLVEENLMLAYRVAQSVFKSCSIVECEELKQEASEFLIQVVEEFEPCKGYAFSTFAVTRLRGYLFTHLRNKGYLIKQPRREFDLIQRAKGVERRLTAEVGKPVKLSEIAETLGVEANQLCAAQQALLSCRHPVGDEAIREIRHLFELEWEVEMETKNVQAYELEAFKLVFLQRNSFAVAAKRLAITEEELAVRLRSFFTQLQIVSEQQAVKLG